MNRAMLISLLLIVGCAETEDQPTTPETATKADDAGLPVIPEAQIENSVVLTMTATVRRLEEVISSFATSSEISTLNSEGLAKDLERLQQATPPESEQVYWDECVAVIKLVQGWLDTEGKLDTVRDVLPVSNRVKALKVAFRINPFDRNNEPLMKAIYETQSLVALPKGAGGKQKLDEADTLAATVGTDDKPAELTKAYLGELRQLVESPQEDSQKLAMRAIKAVLWEMKLDSYRFYQLWREQRDEAARESRNHILNRGGRRFGR